MFVRGMKNQKDNKNTISVCDLYKYISMQKPRISSLWLTIDFILCLLYGNLLTIDDVW